MQWRTLEDVSAHAAAHAIRTGSLSSEQYVEACLARIRELEAEVQAWAYVDEQYALEQARARDLDRREGRPIGPLHGVPVGIKDVFDTADMPTEDGSVLNAGRTPAQDATVVAWLRAAGAVIVGKTVTTEFALYAPGKTRNPLDLARTPGGSSSGSAAAVAAGMVPLALGTQTHGSVIRPAAYCGVFGFKPTHGLIPRSGVLRLSRTLDHVGMFAATLEDIALCAEQLVGFDPLDPDTHPRARIAFLSTLAEEPPLPPTLAFVKGTEWERVDLDTQAAFAEFAAALGERIVEIKLPSAAWLAAGAHQIVLEAELAANLEPVWNRGRERLSASLRAQLERGREIKALDYQRACSAIPALTRALDPIFESCDAIVTPAAAGTAPLGLGSTGDPAFCTLWTLCGLPALSLPLMQSADGMPIGAQLVGRRGDDARLLRTARWLVAAAGGAIE